MTRRLYLHFLDAYHYERARRNAQSHEDIFREAQRALRIALATVDTVYLPASTYFESSMARELLGRHPYCVEVGRILLTAGDPDLESHRVSKVAQYVRRSPELQRTAYRRPITSAVSYVRRPGDTRRHIEKRWLEAALADNTVIESGALASSIIDRSLLRAWAAIPDRLEGLAFVPAHVLTLLTKATGRDPRELTSVVDGLIEGAYVETYMLGLDAGLVRDLVRLRSPFQIPVHPDSISYTESLQTLQRASLLRAVDDPQEEAFLANETRLNAAIGKLSKPRATAPPAHKPIIGFVTILEEEFDAVVSLLAGVKPYAMAGDPHAYMLGRLPSLVNESEYVDVVVCKQIRMTTPSAATSTTYLLHAFSSVQDIVLVGIGGAIPRPEDSDKDVSLGDVVVSHRAGVIHTDHVTRTPAGAKIRSELPPPSARLLGALDRYMQANPKGKAARDTLVRLGASDDRFARPPRDADVLRDNDGNSLRVGGASGVSRLFRGLIASGNALVRDPVERDRIGEATGAMALEMEGAGVAEATWTAGRGYLLVRGLSDYCDTYKNDVWHWYATAAAAAAAVEVVKYVIE